MDKAINIEQCAAKYGVSNQTVERWLKRGYIRGIKLPGGHWRFRPQDLQKFEDECLENVSNNRIIDSTNTPEDRGGYGGLRMVSLDAYQQGKLIRQLRGNGETNG